MNKMSRRSIYIYIYLSVILNDSIDKDLSCRLDLATIYIYIYI